MRSKSALTSRALRRGVPLKTMCSRKCVTPLTSGVSLRAPVRTKKPRATERAERLVSPMISKPLSRTWLEKDTGERLEGKLVPSSSPLSPVLGGEGPGVRGTLKVQPPHPRPLSPEYGGGGREKQGSGGGKGQRFRTERDDGEVAR